MGTPASQALSDATSTSGDAAKGAAPATGSNGQPAANEGFWSTWTAPEQKETREWAANKKYADPFVLAKTAQGLEREAAQLRTAVNVKAYPSDTQNPDGSVKMADENAVKAWRTSMGVPETADKYDIAPPEGSPYPQFTGYLKEVLHQAGSPPGMAKLLANGYESAVVK